MMLDFTKCVKRENVIVDSWSNEERRKEVNFESAKV